MHPSFLPSSSSSSSSALLSRQRARGPPFSLIDPGKRRRTIGTRPGARAHAETANTTSFVDPGPFTVTPLPPFSVPREFSETTMRAASGNVASAVAAASLDETVDASVELFMPSAAASSPPRGVGGGGGAGGGIAPPKGLCLVLPGFLLSARRSYRTLAAHLASHGFAAALVDADDPSASDAATARAVASAAAACAARASAAAGRPAASPPLPVMLIGHSRGAKVAALAAGGWERLAPRGNGSVGPRGPPPLAGLVLLDPVDRATLGPPPGPAYPSALPSVRALASQGVPILVVGAGDNGDIVEPAAGWQAFAAAAEQGGGGPRQGGSQQGGRGRVVELLLPRAKHLDFADTQSDPVVGGLLALAGGIFGAAAGSSKAGAAAGGSRAGPPIGSSADAGAVRRCADAAAAFWAAAVACPAAAAAAEKSGGAEPVAAATAAAVEAELSTLRRALVPDARWRLLAWPQGGAAASAASAGERAQRAAAATAPAAAGAAGTREELMAMRASQLQAALRERGVYYGDCFDKPSLVERLLQSPGAG